MTKNRNIIQSFSKIHITTAKMSLSQSFSHMAHRREQMPNKKRCSRCRENLGKIIYFFLFRKLVIRVSKRLYNDVFVTNSRCENEKHKNVIFGEPTPEKLLIFISKIRHRVTEKLWIIYRPINTVLFLRNGVSLKSIIFKWALLVH